jgi:uncharacterized protein YdaU (DUF1376 family)
LYRDSIELYYDAELPLPSDLRVLNRKLLCTSDDEKEALKYILSEFFYKVDSLYHHTRCDFEIDKFHNTASAKARAGKASADARRKKKESKIEQKVTGVEQVLNCVEPLFEHNPTNQQPLTINQEPLTKEKKNIVSSSVDEVLQGYNSVIDKHKPNWPKCQVLNKKRTSLITNALKLLKNRAEELNEKPAGYLIRLFEAMATDDKFFSGKPTQRNPEGYKCSFETNLKQDRLLQAIDNFTGE